MARNRLGVPNATPGQSRTTGAEVTLPKQETGEKNCGSYEAHNQRVSSKGV